MARKPTPVPKPAAHAAGEAPPEQRIVGMARGKAVFANVEPEAQEAEQLELITSPRVVGVDASTGKAIFEEEEEEE